MIRLIIIVIAVFMKCSFGQIQRSSEKILFDNSFTLSSATAKVIKDYPYAYPVKFKNSPDVVLIKDVEYISYSTRKMHLDIFYNKKKGTKKRLCIVMIHGGGWQSGNRTMEYPTAIKLAESGYTAITIEYRLSPEAKYPAALKDIYSAVRWLKNNSRKYFIDTSKIILYGVSSGAHLASLAGVTGTREHFDGMVPSSVHGVINIDGVLDMTDTNESGKDSDVNKPSVGKKWLGYSYKENPELWKKVSPVNYADNSSPVFLFINSSNERFHAGRDSLLNILKKYNIKNQVYTIPNTPHTFWLFNPWHEKVISLILEFLSKL